MSGGHKSDEMAIPGAARSPIDEFLVPFQQFVRLESSGGLVLMGATALALVWANSPWSPTYVRIWETTITLGFGEFTLSKPLLWWINDAVMAVFFFLVGLEIKREVIVGELASLRRAALPVAAALGGMVVPAAIYFALRAGEPTVRGWGVPMATDIAFALGVLTLLGRRVPTSLKVFLAAFAIVDDIGAVLVIALFYSESIALLGLAGAGIFFALLVLANFVGFRTPIVYAILGFGLWISFLGSGLHPTIAGVLAALTIPCRTLINSDQFLSVGRAFLDRFDRAGITGSSTLTNREQRGAVKALERACLSAQAPLQRLEHACHPWVAFFVMPLFALANAGMVLEGNIFAALANSVTYSVAIGLVVGKQVGITFFSWLAVRSGLALLPSSVTWKQIYGVSWLGGIGFTMSIFVAHLAFVDEALLEHAKIGILAASLLAGVVGWWILNTVLPSPASSPASS